jgi:hypothetical protein
MSQSSIDIKAQVKRYQISFFAVFFLITYWWVGFDGITYSDDVFYILAGESFWNGSMVFSDYHFSTRWGAYIPAGLIGYLFGNDPHTVSAVSLISYIATYFLLLQITKGNMQLTWMSLWFCTQIYFLHFLTKVYPDSLLVFWTCLVPFAAIYRHQHPIKAGILLVFALFMGFLTKETIVFLAPFPILLFYFDRKEGNVNFKFYTWIVLTGIIVCVTYLGYFWIAFGDPFYRITSINAGHYISEFTYADKGFWSILKRLTILPFQTFVERAYWPWLVFALPGLIFGLKNKDSYSFSFSITLICLLVGFWFMSSTLEFYNPIYLNPRHLIILIPILAYLIGSGWGKWQTNRKWQIRIAGLLILGVIIALLIQDWKMAAFNAILILPVFLRNQKFQLISLLLILIPPAMYSIYYQKNLKQYENLIETLSTETQGIDLEEPIYTHSFLDFSKKVLIPNDSMAQELIIPLYKFPADSRDFPPRLKVLIYDYYQHAYPEEQVDIDAINPWIYKNYELIEERKSGNITVYEYALKE